MAGVSFHAGYSSSSHACRSFQLMCQAEAQSLDLSICHCKAHTGHVVCGLAQLAQTGPKATPGPRNQAAFELHLASTRLTTGAGLPQMGQSTTAPVRCGSHSCPASCCNEQGKRLVACINSCSKTFMVCGRRSNSSLAAQPEGGTGSRSCNAVASTATTPNQRNPKRARCMGGTAHYSCLAPNTWDTPLTPASKP